MRDRSRSSSALQRVLLFTTLAVLFSSLSVAAAEKRRFDIAAGEARSTLNEFSRQSELQIYFDADVVRRYMTQAVAGELEAAAALGMMLGGTDLIFEFVNERTVAVMRRGQERHSIAAATTGYDLGRGYARGQISGQYGSSSGSIRVAQASDGPGPDGGQGVDSSGGQDVHDGPAYLESVVVTGTRIRGVAPDSSPLIVYGRKEIEQSGAATVEQFVRQIPQNLASVSADTREGLGVGREASSNISRGAGVNIRGLGSGSTLVLLNGHRTAPSGLTGSFADVSMIPLSAVERIELLTDGASAIYGADAVAGVINFILRKDFAGAETSVRYGDSTGGGADERGLSQLLGTSWKQGNGILVYEYYDQGSLRAEQRSFVQVPPGTGARFIQPSSERHSAIVSGRHEVATDTEIFGDLLYSKREYVQDTTNGITAVHGEGGGAQRGAVLGIDRGFSTGWNAQLATSYSHVEGDQVTTTLTGATAGNITTFATRSRLLSADLKADGPIFSISGGAVRASIGIGGRRDEFDDFSVAVNNSGVGLERDVLSAYGELFIPLISTQNDVLLVRRLELSLAARYDEYDDVGSSTEPKVGLLWSPLSGLNLRGTYGTSFRVPPLAQLSSSGATYSLSPFPNPAAPMGQTNTLLWAAPGNPSLRPEEAESFTLGFGLRPVALPGFSLSAGYFNIEYTDRINPPPVLGSLFTPVLAPFTDFTPDLAEVQRIFAEEFLTNPRGLPPTAVQAFIDLRLQNIAVTKTSGIDLSMSSVMETGLGEIGLLLAGNYTFDLDIQATPLTPTVDRIDTPANPNDLRLRGGISWSMRGFSSSLIVSHTDSYTNDLVTPTASIESWTTADLQLGYRVGDSVTPSILQGMGCVLSAQNVTDEDPPRFVSQNPLALSLGFDPANASPRGRFISLQLSKQW